MRGFLQQEVPYFTSINANCTPRLADADCKPQSDFIRSVLLIAAPHGQKGALDADGGGNAGAEADSGDDEETEDQKGNEPECNDSGKQPLFKCIIPSAAPLCTVLAGQLCKMLVGCSWALHDSEG